MILSLSQELEAQKGRASKYEKLLQKLIPQYTSVLRTPLGSAKQGSFDLAVK